MVITTVGLKSQQICLYDVAYVNKVTGLFAILEYHRGLIVQQSRREDRTYSCIRIRECLPGAVNIKITKRNRRDLIRSPDCKTVLLLILLRNGINRGWKQRLLLCRSPRLENVSAFIACEFPI